MAQLDVFSPFAFDYEDCHYVFDETHIYHCLDDNSRYVVGIFSFNGGHGNWIKFRQRRLNNNSWGGFINHRLEPLGYLNCQFGKHSYDNKFKPNTYDIQNKEEYGLELFNENKARIKRGLKDLKPLVYEYEVIDARRTIVRTSIQTLQNKYVSNSKPVDVRNVLMEYDKVVIPPGLLMKVDEHDINPFLRSFENPFLSGFETSSSSTVSFEVMCLNASGYSGKFVNGGSYTAFEAKDDMLEVVADDGSRHLMFSDRFVRV